MEEIEKLRRLSARLPCGGSGGRRWFGSKFMSVLHTVRYAAKRAGQVTVELLLVLPVFIMMIGFIMELGNLAHQTILAHHCAYELARIGSLVAGPRGGSSNTESDKGRAKDAMESALMEMLPIPGVQLADPEIDETGVDPQPQARHANEDLVVTLIYPARLFFPFSSYVLADEPKSARIKKIRATVRMPIEKPVFQ